MTPEELQQVSYDLEVQKLAIERERQAKEHDLEAQKFAFTQQIEREKLKVEVEKARWAKLAVWFTPASILVSVGIAIAGVLHSQKAQRDAVRAEFELKATEIVLQSDDPEVNWNKACRIQELFKDDNRLPMNWAKHFEWQTYAVENDDLMREVAKLLIEKPDKASNIISTYGALFQSDRTVVDFLNRISPNSVKYVAEPLKDCNGNARPRP